jgi:phosphopantothenoylcysteine decarboxylase / phosphopantothenate---cysteine ligase
MIAGRHIVLGVTGGVAAYKSAYLARRLIERGAEVRVVMTDAATRFVGPATFAAITGHRPTLDLFEDPDTSPHTTLARWADAIVVAPATASTVARMSTGQSSDVLVATVLASTVPVVVAPAMHTEMWEHPATVANIATLRSFGYLVIDPEAGELAGGDSGVGRLADPEAIVDALAEHLGPGDFSGLRVLVTAGGTREAIDPVRYIGNRSSGKMGNALAVEAADRGASVVLVTTVPAPSHPAIEVISVETAQEMADAVWTSAAGCDVAIMAAAVADFRPTDPTNAKLRRADGVPSITLEPTPDVLAGLRDGGDVPIIVGFAAESGGLRGAKEKAERKGVALLVANDISSAGSGFGSDTNEVTLIREDGSVVELPLMSKRDVAAAILSTVLDIRDGS